MARTKVGIIFDDGFVKSSLETAQIFESFGLRAVFAVLANPTGFAPQHRVGDFAFWNELKSRGHIIHPHGYTHANLQSMNYPDAVDELTRCLATFNEKLRGFDPQRAVYCFAYNCGTPALCHWLLHGRVGAARIGGSGMLSDADLRGRVWHSSTFGPEDPGTDLMDRLAQARRDRPDAMLYVLHGLDREAWGAIARDHLRRAIETVIQDEAFQYWPVEAPGEQ